MSAPFFLIYPFLFLNHIRHKTTIIMQAAMTTAVTVWPVELGHSGSSSHTSLQ
jgi:hypothetical protein